MQLQTANNKQTEAQGGWKTLDELDRLAPAILAGGRPDLWLSDSFDYLSKANLRGHPWTRLLLAGGLWGAQRDLERVERLLESAWRSFTRSNDDVGKGYVSFVRGNVALGRGRLAEAAFWWGRARDFLTNQAPLEEIAVANLALAAYDSGDLRAAIGLAEESLALARIRANWRTEATALTYLGFFHLNTGEFGRAESTLLAALDAFRILDNPVDAQETPLCHTALGALYALRGNESQAGAEFERAHKWAEENDVPWFSCLALAVRAEFLPHLDPRKSLSDARLATSQLTKMGDTWFRTWALRATGVATREAGDPKTAIQILKGVLEEPLNPLERARTLLALGETLLTCCPQDAGEVLLEASGMFRRFGMEYWLARTLLRSSQALPASAASFRGEFRSLLREDDAYQRLTISDLEIKLLGNPSIVRGNGPLEFKTHRAEGLVYALVLAERRGLHWEELATRFWPEASLKQASSRLRTALWEARRALGQDAWRLERVRNIIRFDSEGIRVDLRNCEATAETLLSEESADNETLSKLVDQLQEGLLVPWVYEEWVREKDVGREALVGRLLAKSRT